MEKAFRFSKNLKRFRDRKFDTEMKFIFDFIENHYESGTNFVFELESMLYACPNCQDYLSALVEMAIVDGKTITIKMKMNKSVKSTTILNQL